MATVTERLTADLWTIRSRALNYNCGVFISGAEALLIDPGLFTDEIEACRELLVRQNAQPRTIVLTHSHWDHILGPEHFPGVKVVAHDIYREGLGTTSAPERADGIGLSERWRKTLDELERWEEEHDVPRKTAFVPPLPDVTFEKKFVLRLGTLELQLLHAPGHWPDEIVVWEPVSGLLWAGDMLSDLEIPYVSDNLTAYEETLRMISQLDIRVLVPGHGSAAADSVAIRQRLTDDIAYLSELRRAVEIWHKAGSLPPNRRSEIIAGFTLTPRLDANLYPHLLNIRTVWSELGGDRAPANPGWDSR